MKLKLKYLAAAAAMVASHAAFAANVGPDDGSGSMFLNVWQIAGANGGTTSSSYTIDLQKSFSDFAANKNVDLYINQIISDQYFTQMLSAASASLASLRFSVFGGDRVDGPDTLISTFQGSNAKPESNGNLGVALDQVANYTGALNATGSFINPAPGGASFNTSGAVYYGQGAGLNTLAGSSSPNSGFVGQNLSVTQFTKSAPQPGTAPFKTVYPGTFFFGQQAGNYVLQYQVVAVPEPGGAALALAGLGVIGFVGRRRKTP